MPRQYRLGRRQELVDRTAQSILAAARDLVSQKPAEAVSVGAIARRAGVSRLTVYQRFGSRSGLLAALAPPSEAAEAVEGDPRDAVRRHLAERLLAGDALRPGCSLREAEDVLGALTSFALFDRLHHDGRRTPAAVADILMRLAAGILA